MKKYDLLLLKRMEKRANKIRDTKPYKARKHAFALWELAKVQALYLTLEACR